MSAETGEEKYPFPFYTGGRILAPVALGRVRKASSESLSLVATSFDGYVYIIDGKTGCRDVIDVGETSYSIPLIDDLSNSGYLSIVLATMNGEVHCFEAMRFRSTRASLGRTTVSIFIHELDDTQEQVFRYLRRRSRLFRCSRRIHDD